MIKRLFISIFLLFSIISQSFAVVSNAQSSHQLDIQHIQVDHNHQVDDIYADLNQHSKNQEHNVSDCHHCGHCHGSHTNWVAPESACLLSLSQQRDVFTYVDAPTLGYYHGLYRPPMS